MFTCRVVSPWTTDSDGRLYPQILEHYPCSFVDVTGQTDLPPDPAIVTVEATMSEEVFAGLWEDSRYLVLWSEES